MTPDDLRAAPKPPDRGAAVEALWWAALNEWKKAHEAAQADDGKPAAWVHAYLHRVEGDLENAGYWYGRAGKPVANGPLDEEWHAIALELLKA
jgi:hypothetical protein